MAQGQKTQGEKKTHLTHWIILPWVLLVRSSAVDYFFRQVEMSDLKMIPLQTQEQFEAMYAKVESPILVYFTANWCGACKRLDMEFIHEEFPDLPIYKCDIDENKYTPGYCGVKSIPAFIFMTPEKKLENLQSSNTAAVATWINKNIIKK